jgi:hypothetical protein
VGEVDGHRLSRLHVSIADAPAKLIWKPRYSTMGLGVEHFVDWGSHEFDENGKPVVWAPSEDPCALGAEPNQHVLLSRGYEPSVACNANPKLHAIQIQRCMQCESCAMHNMDM